MLKRSLIAHIRLLKIWLCRNPQKVVYEPFIDYATGDIKEGSHYFKPLSRTIMQYVEHLEHKFDGEVGILERKHVQADGVVYIGKEANSIDEQELDVKKAQEFIDVEEIKRKILEMPQKEAERLGVGRNTFQGIKKRLKESGKLNLNTTAVKKLLNIICA